MGLLGKSGKAKAQHPGTTIVAAGSRIRGELILDSALHVDGTVDGSIESTNDVSIGESGSFEGTLRAQRILVSGYVNGKIDCERLEIVAHGKVYGEVTSLEFIIEPGGQFVGESHVKGHQPVPALDHSTDKEEPVAVALEPEQDVQRV